MAQQQKEIVYHNNVELSVSGISLLEFAGALSLALEGLGESNGYHIGEVHHVPTLNLAYGRQLTPLVNVSATLSYMQFSSDILRVDTEVKGGRKLLSSFSFMPAVRFDWYRRDIVRLYSRLGVGISNLSDRETYNSDSQFNNAYAELYPCIDVTPFGVAVGRKLYGFAEVSVGTLGFAKAGVGYRF